jgi:MFS family permease
LYGLAKNKRSLYAALCLSQLTKTNTPILASLASKGASLNEQGQLQGALYAVNALGGAIGPLCMQFVFERTKETMGPGTMFIFASFLYFVGTIIVSCIPEATIVEDMLPFPSDDLSPYPEIEEPLLERSDDQAQS